MKGISSILGTLIFLQILLLALLIIIHIQNGETQVTINTIQKLQSLAEDSPVTEFVQNGVAYIYSPKPMIITHIIYPNGYIANTSIIVTKVPASEVLQGYPWAIIVTSEGSWFNISKIGNNDSSSDSIVFPYYHNYGIPFSGPIKSISSDPNWTYLGGVYGPAGYALVPLNVSVNGQTFNYGVSGVEVVVYPAQQKGWINMTFYVPIQNDNGANTSALNIGLYIPVNITWYAFPFLAGSGTPYYGYTIQYLYTYVWFSEQMVNPYTWYYYQLGSVYPPSNPAYNSHYYGPELDYFPAYTISGVYIQYPYMGSNAQTPPHFYFNTLYYTNPIEVYQFDINIYKGEWLLYGYSERFHTWQLLYNYTYNYTKYTYYLLIEKEVAPQELISYNVNATSMVFPSSYPLYILVPQNVYLLQVQQS
ncbi:hypothetical protein [Sulfurisphaera ohwakuensis]|uniref:Uncharacterized protein n=1 Tax=Sulfurisphaera ohwakuensis TaxID=69656 RepID=A0A650CHS2_SULOH|nr:hypothetical protein [Sulfurisphaera ohwakuensis]MBB5254685.1 hypothetical protein [Sulfurisphaera ohwakuensis]QGR17333.1 hypothetical protein D1869_09105 [Sulfurisphaera ohwakuensis]